jgi:putative addiction module CopG family antidote
MSILDKIRPGLTLLLVNVALDKHLRAYIDYKLKSGGYGNASEVVRDALRHMQAVDNEAAAGLETALLKGLGSPKKPVSKTYFKTLRKTLHKAAARLSQRAA